MITALINMRKLLVLIVIGIALLIATHRSSNCDFFQDDIQGSVCEKSTQPAKGALAPFSEVPLR
jgi:hypothetical protein